MADFASEDNFCGGKKASRNTRSNFGDGRGA